MDRATGEAPADVLARLSAAMKTEGLVLKSLVRPH